MANNLLDALSGLGLIDPTTNKAGNSLQRVTQAVQPIITRTPVNVNSTTAYEQGLDQEIGYLDEQKRKYDERMSQGTILSGENLTSNNLLIRGGTNALNLGGRVLGGVGDAVMGLYALDRTSDANSLRVPDDVYAIHQKQKKGLPVTAEESARLNSQLDLGNNLRDDLTNNAYRGWGDTGTPTYADVIKKQEGLRDEAQWATGLDLRGKLSNKMTDEPFNESLGDLKTERDLWESAKNSWGKGNYADAAGQTWDSVTGASGQTLGALRENPMQLANMVADTLPYLMNRTANVAFAGDAGRIFSDGVNTVAEREGVQSPSMLQTGGIIGATAGYTALNYLERATLLKALGGKLPTTGIGSVASNISGKVTSALPQAVQNVGRFIPSNALATAAGNTAKAVGTEAVAEGFQQQIEDSWSKLSTDFNVVDNTVAATLGGVMGGAFSAPGTVRQIGSDVMGQRIQNAQEQQFAAPNVEDADLVNPESPSFAPEKAINRIIADMNKPDADLTDIHARSQTIRDDVHEAYELSERAVQDAMNPQALEEEFATKRANGEAFLADKDESHPAWAVATAKIEANQVEYEQRKAAIEGTDIAVLEGARDKFKEKLEKVDQSFKQVDDYYREVSKDTTEGDVDEVTNILNAPSFDNVTRMQELAEDTTLPEATRTSMRVVSDALIAQNRMKAQGDVSNSVLKGTDGFRGLPEYLSLTQEAVTAGNARMVQSLTGQISRFEKNLASKLEASERAQQIADQTGTKIQVVRNNDGTWYANEGAPIPSKAFNKNNGLIANPHRIDGTGGMDTLVEAMRGNLEAVRATSTAMAHLSTTAQEATNTAPEAQTAPDVNTDPNEVPSTTEVYPTPEVYPPDADVPATPNPYVDPEESPFASAEGADIAMDQLNADERATSRDTTFRDSDPNARTVSKAKADTPKAEAKPKAEVKSAEAPKAKPLRTKKEASTILATKFSEDTHEVFKRTDGGFGVRARKLVEVDIPVTVEELNITESEDQSPMGGLDVLNTKGESYKTSINEEASKPFLEQNLIKTGFVQRLKEGKNSPLVMVKDFMQTVPKSAVSGIIGKYTGKPATPSQVKQLEYFYDFNKQMNERFLSDDFIKKGTNIIYRNEAYAEFLLSDNGQLEQNIRTAINAASMEWLGESGSTVYSDARTIGRALGVKNLEQVPVHIMARLGTIGTHQNTLASTLGSRVLQALQLKALENVDMDRRSKLEQTLGMLAITSMLEAKLVQRTGILNDELMNMQSELTSDDLQAGEFTLDQDPKAKRQHTLFIRPSLEMVEGNYRVTDAVANIAELNKDTKNVMSTVFGYQPLSLLPSLEPITELPANTDEVGTEVPSYAQEVIKKMQATPRSLNNSMLRLYDAFNGYSKDMFESMMGVQDVEQRHAYFKLSTESKNEQIRRSLGILDTTRSLVGTKAFYLPMTFWVNNRSGYGSVFNPQGDKIHRAFSALSTNQVIVDITDRNIFDKKGKLTQYGQLLRGLSVVIEDVKVPGYGKAGNEEVAKFLPAFEAFINSPEIREATTSLNKIKEGDAKAIDYRNVSDTIISWGIQGIGLLGLDTIADIHTAIDGNKKSVTVNIAPGSDGVNSGASWSQILMGTATPDVMSAVGVFGRVSKGDTQFTNIAQYKSNGGRDLYEQLGERQALEWSKEVRDDSIRGVAVRALDFIDTAYGTRSGAKNAFNPFNYGSGIPAIKRSDARATLDSVYTSVESALMGTDKKGRDLQGITSAINAIIRFHNDNSNRKVSYVDTYTVSNIEETLPKEVENAIFKTDVTLRGNSTEKAIRNSMGVFISRRDSITSMSDNSNSIFNVLRNYKLEQELILYNQEANPSLLKDKFLEGLSAEQVAKLDRSIARYMPSVATPMSSRSENANKSRIPLLDTTYAWNMNKRSILKLKKINYQFTAESSNYVANIHNKKMREGNTANSYFDTYIRESARTGLGVGTHARFIQSHDAFVTFTTMQETNAENNHDENTTDIFNLDAMSVIQNRTYLQGLASSNLGLAYATALLRPLNGIYENQEVLTNEYNTKSVLSALLGAMNTKDIPEVGFRVALPNLIASMIDSDIKKVTTLQGTHAVNQYATEGGEVIVTDTDRKYISDVKSSLTKSKAKLVTDFTRIGKWLDETVVPTIKLPEENKEQRSIPKAAIAQSIKEFGPSRTITRSSFQDKLFGNTKGTTSITLNDLSKLVNEHLADYVQVGGSAGYYANSYKALFGEMIKAMPEGTDINLIHAKDADLGNILGGKEQISKGQRAWYASKGFDTQLNFYNGSDTPISIGDVVHEVIHASTEQAIKAVEATPDLYPKAMKSLDKIKRLYIHVRNNSTSSENEMVKYGISNLDEFIATGLTNPAFIKHLDAMPATIEERGLNRLTTAFRAMVSNVYDLLRSFTGRTAKYDPNKLSAYEALIMDTAEFVGRTQSITGSPDQMTLLGAPHTQAVDRVAEYTAKQVYDALDDGKLDPVFKEQLGRNISDITDRMFSGQVRKFAKTDKGYSPEQIWDTALQNGKAPYLTKALAAGFSMTAQEQFGLEAIEVAITHTMGDKALMQSFASMDRAFIDAKKKLTVESFHKGDWTDASVEDKAIAKSKHDYVFRTDRKDYLTRFVALSIANKEFNDLLDIAASKRVLLKSDRPSFEGMMNVINKAIDGVLNKLSTAENIHSINRKLPELAKDLVNLDLKGRNKVVNKIEDAIYDADAILHTKIENVKETIAEKANEIPTLDSRIGRIVTNVLKTSNGSGMFSIFDTIADFRNQDNNNTRLGFLGELNNEIKDNTQSKKLAERLINLAKQNEGNASRIKSLTKTDMLNQFANGGKDLLLEDRVAISYIGLRTDMQSLLDTYSVPEIKELLEKPAMLNKEIAKYEKQVGGTIYINRTKDLAWYMVSGVGSETLGKNAEIIAGNAVTEGQIESIDKLASLYAIQYSDADHVKRMAKVMGNELSRSEGNGIEGLLKYHKTLVNDSKSVLFADNPYSMIKGYLPDITNPHKDVVIAKNKADRERLESAFYTRVGTVGKSMNDSSTEETTMYYSEDAGKQRVISGAMALFNYGRKGTEVELEPKKVSEITNRARSQFNQNPNYDPRNNNTSSMIPSYDQFGRVTGYNYEMSSRVRDQYLERNNDFSDLVGAFTSLGYTKVASSKQNMVVVEQLHKDYKENFSKDPKRYVYVSYNSNDPVIYNAWDKLPHETKEYVKQTWGRYGMYISNDAFLSIFGTPKMTVTSAFDKDPSMRNMAEEAFIGLMRIMFKDNARVSAARGERIWQEAVAVMKNFVVIRNASTLVMNMVSNIFLLAAHGIKPSHIVRDTLKSIKGGMQYRRDMTNIIRLQNKQRSNPEQAESIQEEINRLQVSIERNPLKEFIDKGMFAGIVEDVDPSQDMYSYQSGLGKKYEKYTDMVPTFLKDVGSFLLVSPGTPHYQFLHSSTQYSDFSSKYVMFKHYSESAKELMTPQDAMQIASENFINYDVPSSPGMQYMNDMGLLMFTKYSLRIQKALFRLIAKRPAAAIGQAMLLEALTNLPPGIEPIVFNQYGIPFRDGALGLFDTWDEPFPIKLLF